MTTGSVRRDWAEQHHPKWVRRATTMTEMTTVLVVDDEPIVRDVVVRYLQRDGFDTLEAGDGDAARDDHRDGPPDLVVLDVMLPGTDGLALCRWIRARQRAAGDHADGARGGGGPDRRARDRRRRLRDQAVLAARARDPRSQRPQARGSPTAGRRDDDVRRADDRRQDARSHRWTGTPSGSPARSSTSSSSSRPTRARCSLASS